MGEVWQDTLDEAIRVVDDVRYHGRQPDGTVSEADWNRLGSVSDYARQVRALSLAPLVVPVPDPPPPAKYLGFAVTYNGHGLAQDCYLGTDAESKEWGIHWGRDLLAPFAGVVEAYQFGVGGAMAALGHASPEERANAAALFEGWTCIAPEPPGQVGGSGVGLQTMYVAVYRPATPIKTSGPTLKALWFGHCRQDIATGPVAAGGRICTSWDSGIHFEAQGIQGRASHVHTCGSATGALTPNGDVDGRYAAEAMGWAVDVRGIGPGPQDYLSGGYVAGKARTIWAGRMLPPVPS